MLERVAGALGFALVVPRVPLRAILTHDVRCDMDVVAAVFCTPVVNGNPPAGCFSVGAGKAHLTHEVRGDTSPNLVPEGSFFW